MAGGTANTVSWGSEPLTFDEIMRAVAKVAALPPAPIFASSVLFPSDSALMFKDALRREYVCAGPAFWARLPDAAGGNLVKAKPLTTADNPLYAGVVILDLDSPTNRDARTTVLEALAQAMGAQPPDLMARPRMPLPDDETGADRALADVAAQEADLAERVTAELHQPRPRRRHRAEEDE